MQATLQALSVRFGFITQQLQSGTKPEWETFQPAIEKQIELLKASHSSKPSQAVGHELGRQWKLLETQWASDNHEEINGQLDSICTLVRETINRQNAKLSRSSLTCSVPEAGIEDIAFDVALIATAEDYPETVRELNRFFKWCYCGAAGIKAWRAWRDADSCLVERTVIMKILCYLATRKEQERVPELVASLFKWSELAKLKELSPKHRLADVVDGIIDSKNEPGGLFALLSEAVNHIHKSEVQDYGLERACSMEANDHQAVCLKAKEGKDKVSYTTNMKSEIRKWQATGNTQRVMEACAMVRSCKVRLRELGENVLEGVPDSVWSQAGGHRYLTALAPLFPLETDSAALTAKCATLGWVKGLPVDATIDRIFAHLDELR
ncbi:MAG: hypothetical protein KDK78_02865, partial [Chlamydiia bacterium]|nr:hypothetical protein [Chlamydiia bacterium]